MNTSYKFVLKEEKSQIISKPFHIIENNKKIHSGQMISSVHYNSELPISDDVSFNILKKNSKNNSLINKFNILIPKNKLRLAYNDLQSKKKSELFVTSISHFYEIWELNYSIYIDFQVYPSDKCDHILITLPTFKIQYFD